jgi:uncharacterized membrane protein YdjX (TVP38/TMEM64 family)
MTETARPTGDHEIASRSLRAIATGLAPLLGLAALFAIAWYFYRIWGHEAFRQWQQTADLVPFFIALAILPAFAVPTTPFYLLAGATFGIVPALLGSGAALSLNLLLCWWLARGWCRPWVERLLTSFNRRIPPMDRRKAMRFALLVKLAPGAPTFIKTYLIAVADVPFSIYFGMSWIFTFLYATGFIVLGESITDGDYGQAIVAFALLAALVLGIYFLRTRLVGREGEPVKGNGPTLD